MILLFDCLSDDLKLLLTKSHSAEELILPSILFIRRFVHVVQCKAFHFGIPLRRLVIKDRFGCLLHKDFLDFLGGLILFILLIRCRFVN